MTRPVTNRWFSHLPVSDVLAVVIAASPIAALLIIAAVAPDTLSVKPGKLSESGQMYRLSPIPPGAK